MGDGLVTRRMDVHDDRVHDDRVHVLNLFLQGIFSRDFQPDVIDFMTVPIISSANC
jgi:hypothetical protein